MNNYTWSDIVNHKWLDEVADGEVFVLVQKKTFADVKDVSQTQIFSLPEAQTWSENSNEKRIAYIVFGKQPNGKWFTYMGRFGKDKDELYLKPTFVDSINHVLDSIGYDDVLKFIKEKAKKSSLETEKINQERKNIMKKIDKVNDKLANAQAQEGEGNMKRFFIETNGYNMVAFVDDKNKAFILHEQSFDTELTLETAKNADYSNLDGCKTAEDCAGAMGMGEDRIFDFKELLSYAESYTEFTEEGTAHETYIKDNFLGWIEKETTESDESEDNSIHRGR